MPLLTAIGAVVAVSQWGWLAHYVGVNQTGPIMTEMPIFMVGIIFGLAMDYEVFLVSRIREAHSHGADARTAIRTVAAGDTLLSPQATRLEVLTAREREIVALVAHGLSNEEIAERLFVSPYTARTHVHRAMAKLDARDRAQLVVIAYPDRPRRDHARLTSRRDRVRGP